MKIYKEITPLKNADFFVILDTTNTNFSYPIHHHPEYELNLVMGCSGNRIVGDSVEAYRLLDLVLLGPYLFHKWDAQYQNDQNRVITIQFDQHLFDNNLLSKEPFQRIKQMLQISTRGIEFSKATIKKVQPHLIQLTNLDGFESIIEFLRILDLLSKSKPKQLIASEGFNNEAYNTSSKRIEIAHRYILKNYRRSDLRIRDIAKKIHMSDSAFSHFFKKNTNKSFQQYILELRLGYACKLLVHTDDLISQIYMQTGFNSIANFNRLFKKFYLCTPLEYRKSYSDNTLFDWTHQNTPNQFLPSENQIHPSLKPDVYHTNLAHH
jgi:AraC-like DNA-binding protein